MYRDSFSEEIFIKCQADLVILAKEISLNDAEKIKHEIKSKDHRDHPIVYIWAVKEKKILEI